MNPADRVRRLVLTGPEATAKTTLAAEVGRRLGAPVVFEYARAYAERVRRPLTADDVEPIARGQIAAEDEALEQARAVADVRRRLLVLDTDLVSTVIYARYYYGACPEWIERAARERLGDLYVLLEPDLPWVADGVRDLPQGREDIRRALRECLGAATARVVEVGGTGEERLRQVLGLAERLPMQS
ncbi:MAG TPA: AAA family ATPase [Gemmatimonadaceae bacterium]